MFQKHNAAYKQNIVYSLSSIHKNQWQKYLIYFYLYLSVISQEHSVKKSKEYLPINLVHVINTYRLKIIDTDTKQDFQSTNLFFECSLLIKLAGH